MERCFSGTMKDRSQIGVQLYKTTWKKLPRTGTKSGQSWSCFLARAPVPFGKRFKTQMIVYRSTPLLSTLVSCLHNQPVPACGEYIVHADLRYESGSYGKWPSKKWPLFLPLTIPFIPLFLLGLIGTQTRLPAEGNSDLGCLSIHVPFPSTW